jgi:hypothetical protein
MKRPFLTLLISLAIISWSMTLSAQQQEKRGYVSTGMGWAYKLNGDPRPSGLQVNFLELGYEVWSGLGLAASWGGGTFTYEDEWAFFNGSQWSSVPVDVRLGYTMFMIGPLYVVRLGQRSSIDLKARVGSYMYDDKVTSSNLNATDSNNSLGYYFSTSYQYRFSKWWTVFASLDYSTNRTNFNFSTYGSMSTLAVTAGIGLRL